MTKQLPSSLRGRALPVALLVLSAYAATTPLLAVTPADGTSGQATINGKPLTVAYAYRFRAPDNWDEKQVNDIAVLTPKALDVATLKQATTLAEALKQAPERIVVESRSGGRADLSICHVALEGSCYSTTVSGADEWKPANAAPGHLAGHIRIFGGHETTVFDKYKLFYEFTFDAAPVRDFAKRR